MRVNWFRVLVVVTRNSTFAFLLSTTSKPGRNYRLYFVPNSGENLVELPPKRSPLIPSQLDTQLDTISQAEKYSLLLQFYKDKITSHSSSARFQLQSNKLNESNDKTTHWQAMKSLLKEMIEQDVKCNSKGVQCVVDSVSSFCSVAKVSAGINLLKEGMATNL